MEAGGIGQSAGWPDVKGRLEQKERNFPLDIGLAGSLGERVWTEHDARADVEG